MKWVVGSGASFASSMEGTAHTLSPASTAVPSQPRWPFGSNLCHRVACGCAIALSKRSVSATRHAAWEVLQQGTAVMATCWILCPSFHSAYTAACLTDISCSLTQWLVRERSQPCTLPSSVTVLLNQRAALTEPRLVNAQALVNQAPVR